MQADGKPRVPQRETSTQKRQQRSLFQLPEDPVLDEIRRMPVDELTPMQALQELYRLRQHLAERK